MSTDWCLKIFDSSGNEIVPSTPLLTMMIERQQTVGTFTASMELNHNFLDRFYLQNNPFYFYNLNYYSRSYPENTFVLKDTILTSVNYSQDLENNNMHVQASWQYYNEIGPEEYSNTLDIVNPAVSAVYDTYYVLQVNGIDNIQQWQRSLEDFPILEQKKVNWQSFGF